MCDPEEIGMPGELASAAGTVFDAVWAIAKVARYPVLYVLLAGALWFYKWWLIGFTLPLGAIGALIVWRMHRRVVSGYAGPSPAMTALLASRGLKPIPAAGARPIPVRARPALPRAMQRALRVGRPKVITGTVIGQQQALAPARKQVTR